MTICKVCRKDFEEEFDKKTKHLIKLVNLVGT